jgi:hypothetical protein
MQYGYIDTCFSQKLIWNISACVQYSFNSMSCKLFTALKIHVLLFCIITILVCGYQRFWATHSPIIRQRYGAIIQVAKINLSPENTYFRKVTKLSFSHYNEPADTSWPLHSTKCHSGLEKLASDYCHTIMNGDIHCKTTFFLSTYMDHWSLWKMCIYWVPFESTIKYSWMDLFTAQINIKQD